MSVLPFDAAFGRVRAVRVLAAAFLLFGCVSTARADDAARWIVVRTRIATTEAPDDAPLRDQLEAALRDTGANVLDHEQAVIAIARRHSTEATPATPDDFDALARESEQALEHVAFGRRTQARAAVDRVLSRAERALETLNREVRSARHVLNSCLYLVRALVDANDRDAALARAVDCARLVPDLPPSVSEHPPAVRELYATAVDAVQAGPHGSLHVESVPSNCAVYVNGRRLGTTPFRRDRLPVGEYRVQAECAANARPGRVHRVVLAAEPRRVVIDTRFDDALRTAAGEVLLEYASREQELARRFTDALRLSEAVGLSDVLLVTPDDADSTRVDYVHGPGRRVVASLLVRRATAADAAEFTRGVRHLMNGESVDARRSVERAIAAWTPAAEPTRAPPAEPASAPAATRDDAPSPAAEAPLDEDATHPADVEHGVALRREAPSADSAISLEAWLALSVGGASLAASWTLEAAWLGEHSAANDLPTTDPTYLKRVADRDAYTPWIAVTSGVGAVGLGFAAFELGRAHGDETLAWVGAGLSLAGVGVGAWLWANDEACADTSCSRLDRTVPLAPLVMATSLPFAAYAVGSLAFSDDADTSVAADVGTDRVGLRVRGIF